MKFNKASLTGYVLATTASCCGSFVLPTTTTTTTGQIRIAYSSSSTSSSLLHASTLDQKAVDQAKRRNGVMSPPSSIGKGKRNNMNNNNNNSNSNSKAKPNTLQNQIWNSGVASAAAMATAAVNAAVAMKTLQAPDEDAPSYIARNRTTANTVDALDPETGLPLQYDSQQIQAYWQQERGALNQRWGEFVGKAVPFFTTTVTLLIRDGRIVDTEIPALARQSRLDLQALGPTFIKLGQMMSVRPDILPPAALQELQYLQDAVEPFDTATAIQQIESELGGPLGKFFTSISQEPVAAASLAQVYLATLNDGSDTRVAIKVQRPNVLASVSKDLYVLRRAAEVFNGLVHRFAPQQQTDYVALLNEWAIGFYTELDFQNEMHNQQRLRSIMDQAGLTSQVLVPAVYPELCTRRILVSEWIDGKKLAACTAEEIAAVTPAAQEAFLTQLFTAGFMHADPHGGNILMIENPEAKGGAKLALIDCGLMASIGQTDRDKFVSAVIHLANKDYAALVDDFIALKILPPNSNRAAIIPLMDKALSPYVKGGGAKKYEEELRKIYGMQDVTNMRSQVGGFQAMTQDALTVLESIPFSIPPSFALLGRAIVTLEGVALTGNPDYGIIMESYPFLARKLLQEGRPEIQKALQEVLYSSSSTGHGSYENSGLKLTRLLALLNNAAGSVATQEGAAFVDLDAIPADGLDLITGLQFVLSDQATSLRNLLEPEMDQIVDVLSRQIIRRAMSEAVVALTPPRPPLIPFLGNVLPTPPALDQVPLPLLLPSLDRAGNINAQPSLALLSIQQFIDTIAPTLSRDEEIFAIGLAEGAREFMGDDIGDLLKGERVLQPRSVQIAFHALRSGVMGRNDLLSTEVASSTLRFVQDAFDLLQQTTANANGGSSANIRTSQGTFDAQLAVAIQTLKSEERKRFDDIVNEIIQRAIRRIVNRLSAIERIA